MISTGTVQVEASLWFHLPRSLNTILRSRYQLAEESSRLKTFAGIDSTCVSVLSGTIRPIQIDTGFVVQLIL